MKKGVLLEADIDPNPFRQLRLWLEDAHIEQVKEPTAMTLATVSADGQPSARIVLLKALDESGLVFYTNYESKKGEELKSNPRAALLFFWDILERQVRVEGIVERTTEQESKNYFRTRPLGSQLGAWASKQSRPLPQRDALLNEFESLKEKYRGAEIPLPPFWGGYRLRPHAFEFWQGRDNRLHDRFRYSSLNSSWRIERLFP